MSPLKASLLALLAVFAPVQAAIITVFVLIIADLITGIWAAKKRGESISSASLRRTLTKFLIYEAALLLAHLTETYLLHDMLPVTKLVSSMVGLVELKSVFENLDSIGEQPLLRSIISKLGSTNDTDKK